MGPVENVPQAEGIDPRRDVTCSSEPGGDSPRMKVWKLLKNPADARPNAAIPTSIVNEVFDLFAALGVWAIYRIGRGWMRLNAHQPMPQPNPT